MGVPLRFPRRGRVEERSEEGAGRWHAETPFIGATLGGIDVALAWISRSFCC